MSTTKSYDIVARVGEYEKDGETKGRYLNVGAILRKDDKSFIVLNRTFNPAGVPNPEARDTVILSLFDPKQKDSTEKSEGNSM